MSDTVSLATRASADGLEPLTIVKDVLTSRSPALPTQTGTTGTLYSLELGPALLHEAFLYHFRSLYQLVAYDAAFCKKQHSWAGVTLYYSNFFSILAMNRLAGGAASTTAGGRHFKVSAEQVQSSYTIEKIETNNHVIVWKTNYELFYNFNWRDTSCDGVVIQVPHVARKLYEKQRREYLNYNPTSYVEMFRTGNKLRDMAAPHGRFYTFPPASIPGLLIEDEWNQTIATLECHAIARQQIVMAILEEVYIKLGSSSKRTIKGLAASFSKNIMTMTPFRSQLKTIFLDSLQELQR